VRTHCENYRWIQWKYPGHRLSSKTLITLWSKDPAKPIYTYSVKGNFHNKELHLATFCNFPGTGQVIPNNQQRTELCRWHWGSETPLNIRAVNLGYLQWKQSLHHPATKLCTTWNRHWNRRHVRHCWYGNYDSNSTGWWQPCDQMYQRLPKVKKKTWTRNEIEKRCHIGAPEAYRSRYIGTLFRHQAAISMNKYNLCLAKNFTHRIIILFTGSNSTYPKPTTNSLSRP